MKRDFWTAGLFCSGGFLTLVIPSFSVVIPDSSFVTPSPSFVIPSEAEGSLRTGSERSPRSGSASGRNDEEDAGFRISSDAGTAVVALSVFCFPFVSTFGCPGVGVVVTAHSRCNSTRMIASPRFGPSAR